LFLGDNYILLIRVVSVKTIFCVESESNSDEHAGVLIRSWNVFFLKKIRAFVKTWKLYRPNKQRSYRAFVKTWKSYRPTKHRPSIIVAYNWFCYQYWF